MLPCAALGRSVATPLVPSLPALQVTRTHHPIQQELNLSKLLEGAPGLRSRCGRGAESARGAEKGSRAEGARRGDGARGRSAAAGAGGRGFPDLRLSGRWLRAAGFDLGQAYEVEVRAGRLVVRAV
ncbi:MAG TPA: SymE family type I addiction module toxin [Thermoanaerobaculia bacterium]|nr:SymE family type I addiction module toxin [Thermoanaerobaculia bacterium]